ncbi:uncharacterized protein METZ01_LOCUS294249, partial [marine metagenome]
REMSSSINPSVSPNSTKDVSEGPEIRQSADLPAGVLKSRFAESADLHRDLHLRPIAFFVYLIQLVY